MGMEVGGYRLPLTRMTDAHRDALRRSMQAADLIA